LAWIGQARGDGAGAWDAMTEAETVAPGPGVTSLLNRVSAQRAHLLLVQGDVAAAARWTEQLGLGADDEPSYPREPEYLVLVRVLLAQDRPHQALVLLERLQGGAAAQDRKGSLIEVKALAARGDEAGAKTALTAAPPAHGWPRRATCPSRSASTTALPCCKRLWANSILAPTV
jgi:LuxR family transcriptional regulator, maltose regulon positive regulatory protein